MPFRVLGFLHLDDEVIALSVLAINVVNSFALVFTCSQLLCVAKIEVSNGVIQRQQGIEEIFQQRFTGFFAKNLLEAKVCEWVEVTCFYTYYYTTAYTHILRFLRSDFFARFTKGKCWHAWQRRLP